MFNVWLITEYSTTLQLSIRTVNPETIFIHFRVQTQFGSQFIYEFSVPFLLLF